MTQISYDVKSRPKKDSVGRTDIGWGAECGRDAVKVGGYLITSRTAKGSARTYTAIMLKAKPETGQDTVVETMIGITFETRATAAFAIWRKYYESWRSGRAHQRALDEHVHTEKRNARVRQRLERQTPDGQKAYRTELNRKARERRAAMTPEDKAADAANRQAKREHDNFMSTYNGT